MSRFPISRNWYDNSQKLVALSVATWNRPKESWQELCLVRAHYLPQFLQHGPVS